MAGAPTRSITLPSKIRLPTAREYMPEDPDDPLKPCPLVPAHRILASRMALHLVKCREAQAQKMPLTQCKFDSTHWVLKKELAYHMAEECDKRELFERYVLTTDDSANKVEKYQPPELPQFEENWDDGPCVSYDPTLKAENEAVLRTHAVASKKERKRFRNSERRRLQELEREGKLMSGTHVKLPTQPLPAQPQLRPPHKGTQHQIALDISKQGNENVPQLLEQLKLESAPPKKDSAPLKKDTASSKKDNEPTRDNTPFKEDIVPPKNPAPQKENAWVSVGKGRRKGGKKM